MKTSPRKRNPAKEKLPDSLVKAAYRLQGHSYGRLLRHDQLNELVKGEPLADHGTPGVPAAYGQWHLFETVEWSDGMKPTTSTICSTHGGELALRDISVMLWMKRAVEQRCRSTGGGLRHSYQLVFDLRNKINQGVAWLDCETGKISKGKPWRDAEELEVKQDTKPSVRPLAMGDVVRCYEDPVTEQQTEGDCLLMSKLRDGDDGREMWCVRFAADGIDGPLYTRSVHVRNRYNNAESSEEGVES